LLGEARPRIRAFTLNSGAGAVAPRLLLHSREENVMNKSLACRARRAWAVGRWIAAAAALTVVWACNSYTLERPEPDPSVVIRKTFKQTVNPQIDILFMVDNSLSMAPLQDKLLKRDVGFDVFTEGLKKIPAGDGSAQGLPDVHIAVISSDTGPGDFNLPGNNCRLKGDGGRFQTAPHAPCATSPLEPDQYFLAASNDQQQKNYAGDITEAFTCIAKLGDQGCGFEGQLKSVRWALDPNTAPPENAGFLREDALLAVILITNEDDCSVPEGSMLFDPGQELVSDPLGPFWSFRCNEFGHLCNIDGKLQPPPRGAASMLTGCISNDTETGRLTKVADEVAFLKGLKADPNNQILVAAITGPATPYSIQMVSRQTARHGAELQPDVVHSCTQGTGEYADPSVRIQQWVQGFGQHGLLLPICADSFAPALEEIAEALRIIIEPTCVEGNIRKRASQAYDCAVNDRFKNDHSDTIETALPACAENDNTPPCWSLEDDADKCAGSKRLVVNRGTAAPLNSLNTEISCSLCTPGVGRPDPGCAS